jgi:hypothetical protein
MGHVNDKLVESTELREAVERLRAQIAQRTQDAAKVVQIGSQASRLLEPMEAYFRDHPLVPDTDEYRSLCLYARSLEESLEEEPWGAFADEKLLDWVEVAITGAASCIDEVDPRGALNLIRVVNEIWDEPSERERVCQALARHDPDIADMYESAWRQLDLPLPDPARGPAFAMRDVLTHFLHHLSPDDNVRSQPWWKPHDGKQGISRADRTKFIYETQLIDGAQTSLVCNQLERIKGLIVVLNSAHGRQPLEPGSLRARFQQAQALLSSLLRVIRLPMADP